MIKDEAFFPRSWVASDPELCRVRMTARELHQLQVQAEVPVRGVAGAARVLGMSRSRLATALQGLPQHQRPAQDGKRYVWRSEGAVRSWWSGLHQPAPEPPKRAPRRKKGTPEGMPVDYSAGWDALTS